MTTKPLVVISLLLVGCAVPAMPAKSAPEPDRPVATAPQVLDGEFWIYRRGDGTTVRKKELIFAKELQFPIWAGKAWGFEEWRSPKLMTVDIRAEVVGFEPVTVPAGTFDAYEIRYECSTRGPFRQTDCGSWTRWYAPQVGNIIVTKPRRAPRDWELIKFKRLPAQ